MTANSPAEQIVQRQLDAYRARDIGAFIATYAPDAELVKITGDRIAKGHDEMRKNYGAYFDQNSGLKCDLVKRMTLGNFVIDQEHVTGLSNGRTVDAIAVYEVADGLIKRVMFIK